MSYIESFFANGSQLLQLVCLAICSLACWKMGRVLRERTFSIAAIAIGVFVSLQAFLAMYRHFAAFFPSLWVKSHALVVQLYHVASAVEILFLILFAVGAVRRGLMAKRAVAPEAEQE